MNQAQRTRHFGLICVAAATSCLLQGQTYRVLPIPGLPGATSAVPMGINSRGDVAGYMLVGGKERAFLFARGNCRTYDITPAASGAQARANAINDAGRVVGTVTLTTGITRGFYSGPSVFGYLYDDARFNFSALAVSNANQMVGSSRFLSSEEAINFGTNGTVLRLPRVLVIPPSGTAPVNKATGVNLSGQIVGHLDAGVRVLGMKYYPDLDRWYEIRPAAQNPLHPGLERAMFPLAINTAGVVTGKIGLSQPHAFLSRNHFEPTQDLGSVDASRPDLLSVGTAINNRNHVVGVAGNARGELVAFLHNGTGMIDLNSRLTAAGWRLIEANGINDSGMIAAHGLLNGVTNRAVVLIPSELVSPIDPLCPTRR